MSQARVTSTAALAAFVLLALPATGFANEYSFKVSYEDIPGVEELEAGDINHGIRILEAQADDRSSPNYGFALATLCGAYVIAADLAEAEQVCDKAVAEGPADTAFNNRGVLRIHMGDLPGAREDFDRARPPAVEEYIETLYEVDPKLIASDNFETLVRYQDRKIARARAIHKIGGAAIEDVLK